MLPDERVRAFLDDVYVTSHPPRVARQASASLVCSGAHPPQPFQGPCVTPQACNSLLCVQRLMAHGFGSATLASPASERGLRILGTPGYIAAQIESLSTQHGTLFARLPDVPDLQVAWLLLLFCALPRAQYVLRVLPPHQTAAFAASHDRSALACLAALLRVEPSGAFLAHSATCGRAQLAIQHGGLGLRSTAAHSCAAYFALWADELRAIEARDPQLWATAALQLQRPACTSRCLTALRDVVHSLEASRFQAPPVESA